jgi:hypothetical protein
VQLAEEPAEILLLLWSEVLVAEEDHTVLDERAVDVLERLLVERTGEVDTVDLGTNMRGELLHPDRRVGHARPPWPAERAADRRRQPRVVTRTTGVKARVAEASGRVAGVSAKAH